MLSILKETSLALFVLKLFVVISLTGAGGGGHTSIPKTPKYKAGLNRPVKKKLHVRGCTMGLQRFRV